MADNSNGQVKPEDTMDTSDTNAPTEPPAKNSEYVKELLKEKINLDPAQNPHAMRLLDEEVADAQAKGKNIKDGRYLDLYKEKPIRLAVKVLVPVKEHPRFNFVGKLLGPKGNSLKRLQEKTMTRMAILGRGSMRDRAKEEEYRNALDPKYSHLNDELHVEIVALAVPAEAHARIAIALAELKMYLLPDNVEDVGVSQMREMSGGGRGRGRAPPSRGPPGQGRPAPGPMGAPPLLPRPISGKNKLLSILDRARVAMEESYQDDGYYDSPAPGYGGDYNGGAGGADYYDSGYAGDYYDSGYSGGNHGRWKGYKSVGGVGGGRFGGARSAPYSRAK